MYALLVCALSCRSLRNGAGAVNLAGTQLSRPARVVAAYVQLAVYDRPSMHESLHFDLSCIYPVLLLRPSYRKTFTYFSSIIFLMIWHPLPLSLHKPQHHTHGPSTPSTSPPIPPLS